MFALRGRNRGRIWRIPRVGQPKMPIAVVQATPFVGIMSLRGNCSFFVLSAKPFLLSSPPSIFVNRTGSCSLSGVVGSHLQDRDWGAEGHWLTSSPPASLSRTRTSLPPRPMGCSFTRVHSSLVSSPFSTSSGPWFSRAAGEPSPLWLSPLRFDFFWGRRLDVTILR